MLCCAIFLRFCIVFFSLSFGCHRFISRYRFCCLVIFAIFFSSPALILFRFSYFLPFIWFRTVNPGWMPHINNLSCAFSSKNVTTSAEIALLFRMHTIYGELHGMKRNQYTVVTNIEKASLCTTYFEISRISISFLIFFFWFIFLSLYTEHNNFCFPTPFEIQMHLFEKYEAMWYIQIYFHIFIS